ncbi:MAG: Gmad2 immunoglobulin-like domain-containing protein [bacterium]|nr:Gmad2 immunoglobulin-like domain-containing protein [bacterium]
MKKTILILGIVALLGLGYWIYVKDTEREEPQVTVTSFEECANAGFPIMESYPRQCRDSEGNLFVENVGNLIEKMDFIRLTSPRPSTEITSPVKITGEARGTWFFEANFPISVVDWDGLIIGEGYATSLGEWMTTDFVPFEAEVEFDISQIRGNYSNRGALILQKANPSDLSENDDALEIPIFFVIDQE